MIEARLPVPAHSYLLKCSPAFNVLATPRRLVAIVEEVAGRETDHTRLARGPKVSAGVGPDGAPTPAASGFARAHGVAVGDLERADVNAVEHLMVRRQEPGRPVLEALSEALAGVVAGLRAAKNMRWRDPGLAFTRPIRWLLALWGDDVVPVQASTLVAGRSTWVPCTTTEPMITVDAAEEYLDHLHAAGILLDPTERRDRIVAAATELAATVGRYIDTGGESTLIEALTYLIASPTPLLGHFDPDYLRLPEAVLATVMRKHQRYLPVRDTDGALLPCFVAVANGPIDAIAAEFTNLVELDDQQRRTLDRARTKFDLGSRLVTELTSLAGVMAAEYATAASEPPAVAQALYEAELPRHAGDHLPTTPAGAIGVPGRPARLPRRAGHHRRLAHRQQRPVRAAPRRPRRSRGPPHPPHPVRAVPDGCPDGGRPAPTPRRATGRHRRHRRVPHPLPGAVPRRGRATGRAHPGSARTRRTPRPHRSNPHPTRSPSRHTRVRPAGPDHATGPQNRPPPPAPPHYDPSALTEPAEIQLHGTLGKTRAALEGITDLDHYTSAVTDLTHAVTEFFDQIYVMDDNPERRTTRLSLLAAITELGEHTLA